MIYKILFGITNFQLIK